MLCPLTYAAIALREAARAFEQAGCRDEAHEADILARWAEAEDAARDAARDAALARSEAESADYEVTRGRDFDRWAASAGTAEIEASLATLQPLMGRLHNEHLA